MTSLASRTSDEIRAILDAHPGGIVEVACDGAIRMANAEACRFLGLSFDEISRRYVPEWGAETLREDGSVCPVEEYPVSICLGTGQPAPPVTIGVRLKNGVVNWADFTAVPLRNQVSGALEGAVVMFSDITSRIVAESYLRESERKLHLLLDQIPAVVWTTNRDLVIQWQRGAGQVDLGIEAGSMVGLTIQQSVGSSNPDYLPNAAHLKALKGESANFSMNFRGRELQSRVEPLRSRDNEIIGTIGVTFDITDRMLAEAERDRLLDQERAARARAEAAVISRDIFLSIASHELKTPLVALQLQTEGTMRIISRLGPDGIDSVKLSNLMEVSLRQIHRLAHLIDQLLDVARITSGALELTLKPGVDLGILALEAVDRLHETFARAACTVTMECRESVIGTWDPLRLEQVITNLLTNAAKYGKGKPIKVSVHRDRDEGLLEVRDDGGGIAEKEQRIIFNRFERAGAARHLGGLGLGLYITREIIRAHRGSIAVTSQLGKGSCFTVRLPISNVVS